MHFLLNRLHLVGIPFYAVNGGHGAHKNFAGSKRADEGYPYFPVKPQRLNNGLNYMPKSTGIGVFELLRRDYFTQAIGSHSFGVTGLTVGFIYPGKLIAGAV